jgi:hypothetical protein
MNVSQVRREAIAAMPLRHGPAKERTMQLRSFVSFVAAAAAVVCMGAARAEGLVTRIEQGGSGLSASQAVWPRWQGRLGLALPSPDVDGDGFTASPLWHRAPAASFMGDYYITGSLLGERRLGGLRATSGLIYGAGTATLGGLGGYGFTLRGRSSLGVGEAVSASTSTVPYLGLGYTGLSPRGGWGFTADVGLMMLNPAPMARLGRAASSWNTTEDLLRELRLTPLVHVGVSYAF